MKVIVITSPEKVKDETVVCNLLFAQGLEILHLRKPGADIFTYENFIQQIESRYRNRIVVHDHYELAKQYHLRGIHLKSGQATRYGKYSNMKVSISCHSVEEIKTLPFRAEYCFLSPIFDSISKQGYQSHFEELPDLSEINIPIIALGGITPEKRDLCREAGFSGIAALGYIWECPEEATRRFTRLNTPFVLSIAGFDPSSGAGVTADLKTFEANECYGMGVCTAVTFQNEDTYSGTHWMTLAEIIRQCELLFQHHRPEFVKIGLIQDFDVLQHLVIWLKKQIPDVKIVWDPILKASAGHVFHQNLQEHLQKVLNDIFLITPNTEELHHLFGDNVNTEMLQQIAMNNNVNILWKGGHNSGAITTDQLITPDAIYCHSLQKSRYTKHGTGCILSSALLAHLAKGESLEQASSEAQLYVSQVIDSNDSLLGYHTLHKMNTISRPTPCELSIQYITAPKDGMSLCEQVEAVCRGGMRWVQLRMKGASIEEFLQTGKIVKEICHKYNALFIINDNVEVARQLDADGIHLGKKDMNPLQARVILGENKIVGATCNTWEDILLRQEQRVDYIGLGPYTFTTTKEHLSPVLGLEGYQRLVKQMQENDIDIPVFAIGGITERDIPSLMKTGIQGIALSGLIKNSNNLTIKTEDIISLINTSNKE